MAIYETHEEILEHFKYLNRNFRLYDESIAPRIEHDGEEDYILYTDHEGVEWNLPADVVANADDQGWTGIYQYFDHAHMSE